MPPRRPPDTYDAAAVLAELREARRTLGLTQVQLAQALGVDPQTVWRWEHHQALPPLMALYLARALQGHAAPMPRRLARKYHRRPVKVRVLPMFVLARQLADTARCWFATLEECAGRRFQYVVLQLPTLRTRKQVQTVACEAHAYEAVNSMQRQFTKHYAWLRQHPTHPRWFLTWQDRVKHEEALERERKRDIARAREDTASDRRE